MELETLLINCIPTQSPKRIKEAVRYSLLAPGKRIRPRLSLACAEMIGLNSEAAQSAAIAIELIHCFTLIHDDLPCMDNDDFRRDQPSCHIKFSEDVALLAGDALIPLAFEILLKSKNHVQLSNLTNALGRLSSASGMTGVIGGQISELDLTKDSSLDDLKLVHRAKTGALFSAALLLPMDLLGILESTKEGTVLAEFAKFLGLSFQLADDLEDTKEKDQPSSVLFYPDHQKYIKEAKDDLVLSTQELKKIWSDKALPLIKISNEVIQKLN